MLVLLGDFLKRIYQKSHSKLIQTKVWTPKVSAGVQTKVWTPKVSAGVQTLVWMKWYIFFWKSPYINKKGILTVPELSQEETFKKFMDFMATQANSHSESNLDSNTTHSTDISVLEEKFLDFLKKSPKFERGDIVRWKKGLKNKKYPKEDQLAMVIEELSEPIVQDARDSGSPYYREPLDLVLALLDDDSDFVVFHYDKRRFELVKSGKGITEK